MSCIVGYRNVFTIIAMSVKIAAEQLASDKKRQLMKTKQEK